MNQDYLYKLIGELYVQSKTELYNAHKLMEEKNKSAEDRIQELQTRLSESQKARLDLELKLAQPEDAQHEESRTGDSS